MIDKNKAIQIISNILYQEGESFLNDEGVDEKVCDEVALAIYNALFPEKTQTPVTHRPMQPFPKSDTQGGKSRK